VVGACQDNVRSIRKNFFFKDALTGKCKLKTEEERHLCKESICKSAKMDVIFVIDSSMSIGEADYERQKRFIIELVGKIKLNKDLNVRVGLIQYSTKHEEIIHLQDNDDAATIIKKIRPMRWMNKQTATGLALHRVSEILQKHQRKSVASTVILITDGNSNDYRLNRYNALRQSKKLKDAHVNLKIVAIGQHMQIAEMKAMASQPLDENLFQVKDFNALHDWATKISKQACTDVLLPSPSLCTLKPLRVVSDCFRGWRSITEVVYAKVGDGKACEMVINSSLIETCGYVCNDPVTGNQYAEGEAWTSQCHKFKCHRLAPHEPLLPIETGCRDVNGNCHKIDADETFRCKDSKGKEHSNCMCVTGNDDGQKSTRTVMDWKI